VGTVAFLDPVKLTREVRLAKSAAVAAESAAVAAGWPGLQVRSAPAAPLILPRATATRTAHASLTERGAPWRPVSCCRAQPWHCRANPAISVGATRLTLGAGLILGADRRRAEGESRPSFAPPVKEIEAELGLDPLQLAACQRRLIEARLGWPSRRRIRVSRIRVGAASESAPHPSLTHPSLTHPSRRRIRVSRIRVGPGAASESHASESYASESAREPHPSLTHPSRPGSRIRVSRVGLGGVVRVRPPACAHPAQDPSQRSVAVLPS
jgi:hypothetical protein